MRITAILAALLAFSIPFFGLITLAYYTAREDVRGDIRREAASLVRHADRLLDRMDVRLNELKVLVDQPCDEAAVELLIDVVYRSPYIREAAIFDQNFVLTCTNFGRVSLPVYEDVLESLPATGTIITISDTEVRQNRSVIVNRRWGEGAGANVLLDPREFVEIVPEALRDAGSWQRFSVSTPHGGMIAATGEHAEAALDHKAEAFSARYPISASVEASHHLVLSEFFLLAPAFALLGGLIGIFSSWVTLRGIARLQSLEAALRQAARRDQLMLHYQPVIDLESGRCIGAEALLRWQHPKQGMIPPSIFIQIAEQSDLIIDISRWVFEQVRQDLKGALAIHSEVHIAINLCAAHFADHSIVTDLDRIFAGDPALKGRVVLEATEREVIDDSEGVARRVFADLRVRGYALALDDFGTGHSSLAYLERFPFDVLKIDKIFVDSIATGAVNAPVLEAIIDLGKRLDIQLLAEGVETEVQALYLKEHQVKSCQGYYFAKPMPVKDFADFLAAPGVQS